MEPTTDVFTEKRPAWRRLWPFVGIAIFGVALWALHRQLGDFKFSDLQSYLHTLTAVELSLAVLATLVGYLSLVGYDWFAIRYVGKPLSTLRIALTAFIGYAFSLNIGHSTISGGAVRMRLYTGWGFTAGDVTRVIGFNLIITTMGQCLLSGILFTFYDIRIPASLPGPFESVRWLGFAMLLVVSLFFVLVFTRKEPIQIRKWNIDLPHPKLTIPAILVSAMDWMLCAVVLYELMPNDIGVEFFQFIGICLLAQILGLISQIPGGLGVFEAAMLHLLPESVPTAGVISALIAFRAIYYLIPFLLAICFLGGYEYRSHSKLVSETSQKVQKWLSPLVPTLISLVCFMAGTILLLSGATPAVSTRLVSLQSWIPLPVVELAHFVGSIVGVLLILLSEALRRRVDAAYLGTAILLVAGIVASLLKGLDYEEAAILSVILLVLYIARSKFNRNASLFAMRFRPRWWFAVGLVIITTAWIGFAAFQRVHYQPELWIHFGFHGDASRFLRASAGIASVFAAFGVWHLLRPGLRSPPSVATPEEIEKVKDLVKRSPDTTASLAFLGDKRFLFSKSGRSFLMFGIQGRTWVVMGNPIGDEEEHEDLIWAFRELCAKAGARSAFYQVSADEAHHYAGCGLLLFKLGEEARVNLQTFSLEGSAKKNLRGTKSKLTRSGASFEVIGPEKFDAILPEIKAISREWLEEKNAGEKSFSLGCFNENYLRNFNCAVVRVNGTIVAFSNIFIGADKHELSADLMRHASDAPPGVMEYLFIELILWSQAEGYHWFSLGMAPLSGLENRSMAPLWNRLGAQIFFLGEHFYNFKGLRNYKEKFDPEWEPSYLACRSFFQLPSILIDTSALIGGGIGKVVGKKK